MIESNEGVVLLQEIRVMPIQRNQYNQWILCLGEFLKVLKCENFFKIIEMNLLAYDLNSESYSFDSGSYLIPLVRDFVTKEKLSFFNGNLIPLIEDLKFA